MLSRITNLRGPVRFAIWKAVTRARMRRRGCTVTFTGAVPWAWELPIVEPTLQHIAGSPEGPGQLTIEIGANAHLGRRLVIEVQPGSVNHLVIGDHVTFGANVRLVLFGGSIDIGPHSRLRDGVMLKSSGTMTVGFRTILQNFTMVHCDHEVVIEEYTGVAERVTILDSDHLLDGSDTDTQEQPVVVDPVLVGRNTWIGANVVILRGARIGRNSVIAAGSVVRKGDYPDSWMLAGAPATAKRALR